MIRRWTAGGLALGRKALVAFAGASVVAVGVAMLVLPGPGILVIPAGLGILALEFTWAQRWLRHVRAASGAAARRLRTRDD